MFPLISRVNVVTPIYGCNDYAMPTIKHDVDLIQYDRFLPDRGCRQ
jgi:hypothetical protein